MDLQAKELLYSGRFEDSWTALRQHIEERRLTEISQSWDSEVRLMVLLLLQCPTAIPAEDLLNHIRLMYNNSDGTATTVAASPDGDGQPWTVNMPSHLLLQIVNASLQNEDHECRHARSLLSSWLENLPSEVRERVRQESMATATLAVDFSHERQIYSNLLSIYIQSILIPLGASGCSQECLDQHGFVLSPAQVDEINQAVALLEAEERTITPDNSRSETPNGERSLAGLGSALGRVKSAYRRSREALNELWQKPKPALSLAKDYIFAPANRRRTVMVSAGSFVFVLIALLYGLRRRRNQGRLGFPERPLSQRPSVFALVK